MNPARLKASVLNFGNGPDLEQSRAFLNALDLSLFLEPVDADLASLDISETIRLVEDYKPLDWNRPRWRPSCAAASWNGIPAGATCLMATAETRT